MDISSEKNVAMRTAFRRSLVQTGVVALLLAGTILLLYLMSPTAFGPPEAMGVTMGFLTILLLFVGVHMVGTVVLYLNYKRRHKTETPRQNTSS